MCCSISYFNEEAVQLLFEKHLLNVCCNLVKYMCWLVPLLPERAAMGYQKLDIFRAFPFKIYPEDRTRMTPKVVINVKQFTPLKIT